MYDFLIYYTSLLPPPTNPSSDHHLLIAQLYSLFTHTTLQSHVHPHLILNLLSFTEYDLTKAELITSLLIKSSSSVISPISNIHLYGAVNTDNSCFIDSILVSLFYGDSNDYLLDSESHGRFNMTNNAMTTKSQMTPNDLLICCIRYFVSNLRMGHLISSHTITIMRQLMWYVVCGCNCLRITFAMS